MDESEIIRQLRAQNEQLRLENKLLKAKIHELEARLAQYENAHTPPSLRRGRNCNRKKDKNNKGKPVQKAGHKGVTRPSAIPDGQVEVTADRCPDCGAKLALPFRFESKIIEEIPEPQPVIVTEYKIAHYMCPCCRKEVVACDANCPHEGKFGNNVIAQTTLMRYEDRLPHRKIQDALKRAYGLLLSPATTFDLTRRAGEVVRPEYDAILEWIRGAPVLYVDGMGIHVQREKHWIWTFTTPSETFFMIRKSRGTNVLIEVLTRKFMGIIVCEGWKPYARFSKILQRCWAHLLRESKDLFEMFDEVVPLHEAVKELYESLTRSIECNPPPEVRVDIWNSAREALQHWIGREYLEVKVQKSIGKISNGFDYWFTFILNQGVELTNNRAERALRPHVMLRKIVGTLRNDKGTAIHELIMTALTTWGQRGLDCLQMLTKRLAS